MFEKMKNGFKKFDDRFNWLHEKVYQWYFLKVFIVFFVLFDLLDKIEINNIFARFAVVVPIIVLVLNLYLKPEDPKKITKPTQSVNRFLRPFYWLNEKMTKLNIVLYQMHNFKFLLAMVTLSYSIQGLGISEPVFLSITIRSLLYILFIMLFMKPRDKENEDDKKSAT